MDAGNAGDIEGDFWDAVDAGVFGHIPGDLSLDGEDGSDDSGCPSDFVSESVLFSQGHTSHLGRSEEKVTRVIREYVDELTPDRRLVFYHLQSRIALATTKRVTPARRESAVLWIFGAESREDISFADCCEVLGARPWIVRLRVQLQFWFRDMRFTTAIPALVTPLPARIVEEAFGASGEDGIWVVRRLWEWPGAGHEALCRITGAPAPLALRHALEHLEQSGIIVSGFDGLYWYCVGHSPLNRYGQPIPVSWASFWKTV
ncbi:hypothetical protein HF928_11120 [Acidithiobacillus ferriphilus]|nr:hypothetical protein [Acidithiobacillus ferriphilus]